MGTRAIIEAKIGGGAREHESPAGRGRWSCGSPRLLILTLVSESESAMAHDADSRFRGDGGHCRNANVRKGLKNLERETGFEPATLCVGSRSKRLRICSKTGPSRVPKTARSVFVQKTRNEGLIRQPFFERAGSDRFQVLV